MKRTIWIVAFITGWLWMTKPGQSEQSAISDDPLWKAVTEALGQGQPKTALERLEPIAARAQQNDDAAEKIRVLATKIRLEVATSESSPDAHLKKMRAAIDAAGPALQPVLEAIHASWMWEFFQQHRWQFAGRTAVAEASPPVEDAQPPALPGPDDDLLTWDLPRILQAVDGQFSRSLRAAELLKQVPIERYKKVLAMGTVPVIYRPTMYDILAHHALQFYTTAEQAGSRSAYAYDLLADSPVFSSADEFLAWQPDSSDNRAPLLVAVLLYQDLLKFHQSDSDPTARLDIDLARLEFANSHAVGQEKLQRFETGLRRYQQIASDHPLWAQAQGHLAQIALDAGNPTIARQLASQAVDRFPDSPGGIRCYNLIQQIEAREAQITTERIWNDPWPNIEVHYRNITKVYFRLVQFDFIEFVKSQRWSPEALGEPEQRKLLAARPVKSWSSDLPATQDFKRRTHEVPIPTDLPPGAYVLLASHREDFADADNQLSLAEVWVSRMALVTRIQSGDGKVAGLVLEARTGTPIANTQVQGWQHEPGTGKRTALSAVTTDAEGHFQFPIDQRGPVWILASHGNDRISSANMLSNYTQQPTAHTTQQTLFFTDRSMYRPGQTIRFKGICYSVNQDQDSYQTLGRRSVVVALLDANHQEVERLTLECNDLGSFSGSFTAPRDRLTGSMIVQVMEGPSGQTSVRVEEYKRPKFEVELLPALEAAKLGQSVVVPGKATAYTGATVPGAKVQWRVVRQVRYPRWWYWRMWWLPPAPSDSQEIAQGQTTTDDTGRFQLDFVAKPDPSATPDSQATFHYSVYADVTDGTGETRSAERSVSAGYVALSANLSAEDWQTTDKKVALTVKTTDLDGQSQSAAGQVRIHALKQPASVARGRLSGGWHNPQDPWSEKKPSEDPSNIHSWPLGEVIFEKAIQTDANGHAQLEIELGAGVYRAVLATKDRFGQVVLAELPVEVLDVAAPKYSVRLPQRLSLEKSSIEPDQTLRAVWGSGYDTARALVEVEHRGKIIQRNWTDAGRTQSLIELPITQQMRGGVTLHVTFVSHNRAYLESRRIDVPWSNKELKITWERFVSKLGPAQKETWTAVIQGPDAQRAAAEMVATLYDASLDVFAPHHWISGFGVFRQDYSQFSREFANVPKYLQVFQQHWSMDQRGIDWRYPMLDVHGLTFGMMGGGFGGNPYFRRGQKMFATPMMAMEAAAAPESAAMPEGAMLQKSTADRSGVALAADGEAAQATVGTTGDSGGGTPTTTQPPISLAGIPARTNLNETAFFFPHLISSSDGLVKLEFTMPEALTRWRFLGFAHDQQLRGGLLSDEVVTSKDLMIQPNPPRFLREGDELEMTVKVTNLSVTRQTGQAALNFLDPQTNQSLNDRLSISTGQQQFDIPAGGTQTLSWRIRVPDGIHLLTYRSVASTGRLSDGEEGYLPVLSRRILVTESLPLPIRGQQTKQFHFQRLIDSGKSSTLQHQSLTVQMASNPAWYAVMSLPYLMEYPHQCSEQLFNRLYANCLAGHIAASDPKIERVFQQWRGTEALDSPMQKNQEIKSAVLEESPWVRQAQAESQSRRNVGILFDQNRLRDETTRALTELAQRQLGDGRWAWFPDGPPSDYITLYITTGFGRLRHLGVAIDPTVAIRSLGALDNWMAQQHQLALEAMRKHNDNPSKPSDALNEKRPENFLSHSVAMYLYGRSFFLPEHPIGIEHQSALQFWLDQAQKHWLQLGSLQSQAHLALALHRFDQRDSARKIMASLKERSLTNEEMGTYWATAEQFYWWYHAPIESQAALIEAFDEVAGDAQMVEDCKVWLLKQKQTQDWKTTKATADAVYALLLRGTNLLASDQLVEVQLGQSEVKPDKVEAGTGFYQQRRLGSEVTADSGEIRVTKRDAGIAWGSVHWQYFQDIDQITSPTNNPLQITKELYVKRNTDRGPELQPIVQTDQAAAVQVGDELVVRLVLKVDRDLEYVHLRDHRGSGTEPVNVLSGYRYQDGLGYYESTRDTASHFFIDYLRRGTYVFEYSTRVQLAGSYSTGMANVQCMYAPEFNSHSQSIRLEVTSQ